MPLPAICLCLCLAPVLTLIRASGPDAVNLTGPQDWIHDASYDGVNYSTSASSRDPPAKALFSCVPKGANVTVRWFRLIWGFLPDTVPKGGDRYATRDARDLQLLLLNTTESHNVMCEAVDAAGRVWRSRSARLRTRPAERLAIRALAGDPAWLFTCARTDEVAASVVKTTGPDVTTHTFVYEDSGQYSFEFFCKAAGSSAYGPCGEGLDVSGAFVAASAAASAAANLMCIKHWTAPFITAADNAKLPAGVNDSHTDRPLLFNTTKVLLFNTTKVVHGGGSGLEIAILRSRSKVNSVDLFATGESARLHCLVRGGGDAAVTWTRGGRAVASDGRMTVEKSKLGSRLTIKSLQVSDSGVYWCEVSFGERARAAVSFSVIPAVPESQVRQEHVLQGDTTKLQCCCPTAAEARRRIRWVHDGELVETKDETANCSVLHRLKVTVSQLGAYQCLIESPAPPDSSPGGVPGDWLVYPPLRENLTEAEMASRREALPFLFYSVNPVALMVLDERNEHDPKIQLSAGDGEDPVELEVNLQEMNGKIVSLIVDDRDRNKTAAGRVDGCTVACNKTEWKGQCPVVEEVSAIGGSFIGKLTTTKEHDFHARELTVNCTDRGPRLRRSATKRLRVTSCQPGASGKCKKSESQSTGKLISLSAGVKTNLTKNETRRVLNTLTDITTNASTFNAFDLQLSIKAAASVMTIVDRRAEPNVTEAAIEEKAEILQNITEVVSNCLNVTKETLKRSQERGRGATQLLRAVDRLSKAIPVRGNRSHRVLRAAKLVVGAARVVRGSAETLSFVIPHAGNLSQSNITRGGGGAGAVSISINQSAVEGDRVDFSCHGDDALFSVMANASRRVVSPVIAARTVLRAAASQQAPVQLRFNRGLLAGAAPGAGQRATFTCAFWNGSARRWEGTGCESREAAGQTECSCSHLTNFALVMDLDRAPISRSHQLVLSALSYLLLTVSCQCLALTAYVYLTYLRRKQAKARAGQAAGSSAVRGSRVLLSFCTTLLAAHLLFLATAHYSTPGPLCRSIGAGLHYLFLSVLTWSVAEGANVFISVVYVALQANRMMVQVSKFYLKAALLSWGLPALVVGLTLGATRGAGYGLAAAADDQDGLSLCFLRQTPFYFAFLLPFLICMLLNLVVVVLLGYILHSRVGNISSSKRTKSNRKVLGFVNVCVVLNCTWIFGIFNFGAIKVVANYLFVILNGLQGVFLFLSYCVVKKEVLNHMRNFIWCFQWLPKDTEVSSSSSRTQPSTADTDVSRKMSTAQSLPLIRRKPSAVAEPSSHM